jgi:hypothetical protein
VQHFGAYNTPDAPCFRNTSGCTKKRHTSHTTRIQVTMILATMIDFQVLILAALSQARTSPSCILGFSAHPPVLLSQDQVHQPMRLLATRSSLFAIIVAVENSVSTLALISGRVPSAYRSAQYCKNTHAENNTSIGDLIGFLSKQV